MKQFACVFAILGLAALSTGGEQATAQVVDEVPVSTVSTVQRVELVSPRKEGPPVLILVTDKRRLQPAAGAYRSSEGRTITVSDGRIVGLSDPVAKLGRFQVVSVDEVAVRYAEGVPRLYLKDARGRAVKPAELAVELGIRVADGSDREAKRIEIAAVVRPPRRAAPNGFPGVKDRETVARRVARGTRPDKLARLLAAVAHPQRLGILLKLLAGEATHKLLTKATRLKAGPLYYHLRELREAGLIGPRVRDLYVLTRQGRRLILAAMATERLCRQL